MRSGCSASGSSTLSGLRESSIALSRTRAVYLLSDMMERIRANPDAEDAYDCATYASGPREHGCAPSGRPREPCTARELAEDDLARWQKLAHDALPLIGPGMCDAKVVYLAPPPRRPTRRDIASSCHGPSADRRRRVTLTQELAVASGRSS